MDQDRRGERAHGTWIIFSSFFSCSRLRGIVIAEYLWTGASCMLHVLDAGAADPSSTFHSPFILPFPASPPPLEPTIRIQNDSWLARYDPLRLHDLKLPAQQALG